MGTIDNKVIDALNRVSACGPGAAPVPGVRPANAAPGGLGRPDRTGAACRVRRRLADQPVHGQGGRRVNVAMHGLDLPRFDRVPGAMSSRRAASSDTG